MIRVVFDTQVYLRALINSSSVCGSIAFDWASHYNLCVTAKIEFEVLDVLNRPSLRQKFKQITDERVALIASRLKLGEWVTLADEDIEPISRDPKDDVFLACAKAASADYLVSEDQDLLVLKQHVGTKIVDSLTFLNILKGGKEGENG